MFKSEWELAFTFLMAGLAVLAAAFFIAPEGAEALAAKILASILLVLAVATPVFIEIPAWDE